MGIVGTGYRTGASWNSALVDAELVHFKKVFVFWTTLKRWAVRSKIRKLQIRKFTELQNTCGNF